MKTIYNYILKALCLLVVCLITLPANAQIPGTEYFMKSSYQKQTFNPALRARQGYLGIPLLSNTSLAYQTNTLNLDHLVFDTGQSRLVTFLHPDVSADQFLNNMNDNNKLSANVNETILSYGKYLGEKGFLFADISARGSVNANIPYSFFEFAKKGIAQNEDSYYELHDLKANLMGYIDIGAGYSHSLLDDKLIVGGKFKVLLGAAYANLKVDKAMINAGIDQWEVGVDALIHANYFQDLSVDKDEEGRFDGINKGSGFKVAGFGLGLDLGGSLNLSALGEDTSGILSRFTVSLAFTDIGFISWNKGSSLILTSSLEDTVITGNYIIDLNNSNSLEEEFDKMTDKLKDITDLQEQARRGKTSSLNTNMNIGVEYEVIPEVTVGFLSSTRFSAVNTYSEFTLGGSYRPCDWFEAGLSYSFIYNKFNTLGLALHFAPKKGVNFFVTTDYFLPKVNEFFIPVKAKGMNAMVGISVPMGSRM